MQIDSFENLKIQYNTGQIPPPFCYTYSLEVSFLEKENFEANFKIEYYDREEITEEEIYEEGFSLDDDFSWDGALPAVWGNEIIKKLKSTNWKKKPSSNYDGSEFVIKLLKQNQSEVLQPAKTYIWEIFIQEIIQAIFELDKREAPLQISFISKNAKGSSKQVDFEYSFARRHITIKTQKNLQKSMDWEEGQKQLKYIFGIDFLPENGIDKMPGKIGHYLSPGDGLWYELKSKESSGEEASKAERLIELMLNYVN